MSTPFDIESAIFLNKIQNISKYLLGQYYFDLLQKIRSFKKPNNLMGCYNEIYKIINFLRKLKFFKKKENLSIMHCVSAYPASKKKINLNSIYFLKKKFPNVTIGYSDHTLGYNITSLSYVVGAEIIEKHFTLSNNFSNFRDHKISLSLNAFSKFVKKIQSLKNILGNSNKIINPEEKKNLHLMRRKLILNKNLKRGHKIK